MFNRQRISKQLSSSVVMASSVALLSALGACAPCADGDASCRANDSNIERAAARAAKDRAASLVAKVELDGGAFVEFHEPVPGQLLVASLTKTGTKLSVVEAFEQGNLSASDAYRKLAKAEPPAELVAAEKRAKQAALEASNARDAHAAKLASGATDTDGAQRAPSADAKKSEGKIGRREAALNGSTFMNYYCSTSSYYNFKYCWLDRTGHSWARYWSQSMYSTVNATSGAVLHTLRSFNVLWWNITSFVVQQGMTLRMSSTGGFTDRWTYVDVLAPGSRYHMSVFGRIL
ncbi:MAG: hypothetical protein KC503_32880 [Myxococcales bacterium]|nr:hypothetical protein [Myxococcales bacterium]